MKIKTLEECKLVDGGIVFGYHVNDPERYGVVEYDDDYKVVSIEEKPANPKSNYAVPGLYLYDNKVVEFAENLIPSTRGELEITDINQKYLEIGKLNVQVLGRGVAWLDTGTAESLQDASTFIQSIEKRQSFKIGCPEEIALRRGFIEMNQFKELISLIPDSEYRNYLVNVCYEIENTGIGPGSSTKDLSN